MITRKNIYLERLLLIAMVSCSLLLGACSRDLPYGRKCNDLRKKLFIPIIEDNMIDERLYKASQGNKWSSRAQVPKNERDVLHVWKLVTPLTDTGGLFKESDGFRRKISDSIVVQLNIESEIIGDSCSIRTGQLFLFQKDSSVNYLTESGIDSICKQWGMLSLVRGKGNNCR